MALIEVLFEPENFRPRLRRKRKRTRVWMESRGETDEDGSVLSLARLCLLSVADNMKNLWAKDYADNYIDQYSFRHIMGPFNCLPGDVVEELTVLLCARKELSRAALHLLLLPQCRSLSLKSCPGLATSTLCGHISARCQGLLSLNLSGAQQLRSKVLCETLQSLPALRSLTLAGTPCDKLVIETITQCCRSLRHLDVSCCHLLSPVSLLPLGGGPTLSSSNSLCASLSRCTSMSQPSVSSSSSSSPVLSPLPLTCLLALDIGFSDKEVDLVPTAAYLLLSIPSLERVAMEGVGEACCLIEHRQFSQTDDFTSRERIPKLEEVWRDRKLTQDDSSWKKIKARAINNEDEEEEDEERMLWEGYDSEDNGGPSSSQTQTEEKFPSRSGLILQLKDVRLLTCESLNSVGHLCPGISSLAVTITDDPEMIGGRRHGSLLAAGLKTWSGRLQSLSVEFSGPLVDLLPALQIAGHSLVSLTLEGVKTSNDTPLLEVITACPRLKELLISAEPPPIRLERRDWLALRNLPNQPSLPHLSSLSINFSHDHIRRIPSMSWSALSEVLCCLLIGSPLLKKLSLVSLPCLLDNILQMVLRRPAISSPLLPLAQLQHINMERTNVNIQTLKSVMHRNKRLTYVDVSHCWKISKSELETLKTLTKVQVVGE